MADVTQKKKQQASLANMDMPGADTSPGVDPQVDGSDQASAAQGQPTGQVAQTTPGYTDPDTGKTSDKEPGLEEGDLYMDYVSPVKSLFTGGLTAAAGMVGRAGVQALKNKMPAKENSLDYSQMPATPGPGSSGKTYQYRQGGYNGQMGAGNTTDATNGWTIPKKPTDLEQ